MVVNTFGRVWTEGFNAWSNSDNWHNTAMAWKIDLGLFQGNFWQVISRFTWELPQTLVGYMANGAYATGGGVKNVGYYGGATVVETYAEKWGAMTLGSYIMGQRGIEANPNNWLFQHEYGHYLQSQASGPFYLQRYGIPSALSKGNHDNHPVEQDANARALKYFMKHEPDFESFDNGGIYTGKWDHFRNPINDYDWSRSFYSNTNQTALSNARLQISWYDWMLGPNILINCWINTLTLNKNQ